LTVLAISLAAWGQPQAAPSEAQPAAAPAPPPLLALPPETPLATVDGYRVTAGDVQTVLRGLGANPGRQQEALKNPEALLRQFGLLRRLAAMAEKGGLDQKSPYREELAYNRMWTLAQAQLQAAQDQMLVTPDEIKKHYEENLDAYARARVKVIYIPFSPDAPSRESSSDKKVLSEKEARALADKIYAQLQAGADFVKMVKEYSQDPASAARDGDFTPIRRSDRIPEEIKSAIFSLKAGEFTKPLAQPNGFYIFRVEEIGPQPFEEVRESIANQLRDARMNEFMLSTEKSVEIRIDNPAAFGLEPPAAAK